MIPKLKIIPLGGLGEIGKNMTAIEFGSDMIVVDCGMGFPDEDMYGVDIVLPDFSYLKANAARIRGLVTRVADEPALEAEIRAFVKARDGVALAQEKLSFYLQNAISCLQSLPESEEKCYLAQLAEYVGRRTR